MSEASLTSNLTGARISGWVPACTLMLLALLWPAFWNGFPIIFHDTGGYLARPFEATLQMGRAAIYGAFLLIGVNHNFWPNILIQGALVAWLVILTLRLHGFGGRPWLATSVVATLCVVTGLPWYVAQLMPDILVPLAVLAIALLAFHSDGLRRWERAALVVVIAAAVASHMSILALALGLLLLLAILQALRARLPLQRPALRLAAAGVAAGIVLAPLSNYAITKEFGFTPGGFNFVFSRLVQDGIVDRYLADHCPGPAISLCAYRPVMPKTADDWLWALDSPIYKLGGLEEFEAEAQRIVLDSLTLYPGQHLATAVTSTIKQLALFATGDGLTPWSWYTRLTFQYYAPDALDSYVASRQSTSQFDFSWINLMHIPIQALAILALPLVILARPPGRLAEIATLLTAALLCNAAICGVLSNPHDRYQSRLAWLAVLLAMITALSWHAARSKERRRVVSRADDAIDQQQATASSSLNRTS
jgi:hypothetical protein